MKTFEDITVVICNWRTAGMTRGCINNIRKWYPQLENIVVADDGSESDRGDYFRAYARDAYNAKEKLDLDIEKLRSTRGITLVEFSEHMGHGHTLDRVLPFVQTDLMLTIDSDIRLVGPGLLEEYLEKYNEDEENIYAVGTQFSDGFTGQDGPTPVSWRFTWVDPFFSLWNMEPLHRYCRLSFGNFIAHGNHFGTAGYLNWQLQYDEMHRPRGPYRAIIYPEPDQIKQLWHLRKFPSDPPECERALKWKELFNG